LQANEIAATQALGPSQLLSTATPTLAVAFSNTNLTLSWPLASAGFALQTAPSLSSALWTTVPTPPQIVGGQWQVTFSLSGSAGFYRLMQ